MTAKKAFVFVFVMLLLAGCAKQTSSPTAVQTAVPGNVETQPATAQPTLPPEPVATTSPSDTYPVFYTPVAAQDTYPIESTYVLPPGAKMGPDFKIDRPVKVGAKVVTGTGPAGIPIMLIDMNEPGKIWGEVTIDSDGKFEFILTEGLPSNHMVALRLGEITGTNIDPNDFIYNPNYIDRYLLGVLFDYVVVED